MSIEEVREAASHDRPKSAPKTDSPTGERQHTRDGVGPLYHRIYSIPVESTWENALRSMKRFQMNINGFSPQSMCRFEKRCGDSNLLKTGDEFQIHITGPWNGPVRVADASETCFTLVTLDGHMEAGEIQFRIKRENAEWVKFEIESLARSKDMLIDLVYDRLPIVRFAQTEMWTSVCESMGRELSWGRQGDPRGRIGDVEILTEKRDEETGEWQTV